MPVKELMRWDRKQKRWFKKFGGRKSPYAVSPRQLNCEPTRDASREAANHWWEAKVKEIKGTDPPEPKLPQEYVRALAELNEMLAWFRDQDQEEHAAKTKVTIANLKSSAKSGHPFHKSMSPSQYLPQEALSVWQDRIEIMNRKKTATAKERTIKFLTGQFLERKKAQAQAGQRSVGRWAALARHLDILADFLGDDSDVGCLTAEKVEGFHTSLLGSQWSAEYQKTIFVGAKQFVTWCWERGLIELPRNLKSKDLSFSTTDKKIRTFSVAEIQGLLNAATPRTKLYLLLMLNCGFQQNDIATLTKSMIDFEEGRIIRSRSKTKRHASTKEVNYKLWPETLTLLKKEQSSHETLVLTNSNGSPIRQEFIENGKLKRIDNIVSAFKRLILDQMEIDKKNWKPLKLIRKTSSSLLGKHPEFKFFSQYFLAHSARTVADKHYVEPDQESFDRAIDWLRTEYGIDKKKRGKKSK